MKNLIITGRYIIRKAAHSPISEHNPERIRINVNNSKFFILSGFFL